MEREIEKTLMEIECAINNHEKRGNTYTESALEQAREIIAMCARAAKTPSELRGLFNNLSRENVGHSNADGIELKPCPFCGKEAAFVVEDYIYPICGVVIIFTIQCLNCSAKLPETYGVTVELKESGCIDITDDERKRAATAWNVRNGDHCESERRE